MKNVPSVRVLFCLSVASLLFAAQGERGKTETERKSNRGDGGRIEAIPEGSDLRMVKGT
jgi:hypothetical protein